MTSHELAKKLLELPDLPVTVRGYEGGVDIIEGVVEPAELLLDYNKEWYYGKHEYLGRGTENDKNCSVVQAIHIG